MFLTFLLNIILNIYYEIKPNINKSDLKKKN